MESVPLMLQAKKKKKNGKVGEFKENMGAIPWATLVLPISTCINQVYDGKKYMQSIGVIKRSIYTDTYPWKRFSLLESTSVLVKFYHCLPLSCYAMMFKTIS